MKKSLTLILIAALFLVSACEPKTQTPSIEQVSTITETVLVPTNTSTPAQITEPNAEPTITSPAATNTPEAVSVDYSASVYLDDRSSAAALIYSIANAFNRHEYLRAYSYWSDPMDYIGIADAFSNHYANVTAAQVTLGTIYSEGAAGNIYTSVPVVFNFTHIDTTVEKTSSCFLLRFPQPANFAEPPVQPLHIAKGGFNTVSPGVSDSDALTSACYGTDYSTAAAGNPPESHALESLANLGADNYIDNRSGAVEVVSSVYNAINRKEYARAYAYWQDSTAAGNFADYAAGFADTGAITATFGEVTSDAGAGQYYYAVPVTQKVQSISGATQTFVGCYTLHLSNPAMQVLRFEPLGIVKGKFALVPDGVDLAPLMRTACN